MIRLLCLLIAGASLVLVSTFVVETNDAAALVYEQSGRIVDLGDEVASEIALSVVVDKYPYTWQAFLARLQLAGLEQALDQRAGDSGLPLRDPLIVSSPPHLGPAGLLALAIVILAVQVAGPRSRVRAPAACFLVLLAGGAAIAQGWAPIPVAAAGDGWSPMIAGGLERGAWAAFPWIAAGGLALSFALALVPRRRRA